jgi:hypothetical protein
MFLSTLKFHLFLFRVVSCTGPSFQCEWGLGVHGPQIEGPDSGERVLPYIKLMWNRSCIGLP